jgi:hypothetical protein
LASVIVTSIVTSSPPVLADRQVDHGKVAVAQLALVVLKLGELVPEGVELLIDFVLGDGRIFDFDLEFAEVRECIEFGPERDRDIDLHIAVLGLVTDLGHRRNGHRFEACVIDGCGDGVLDRLIDGFGANVVRTSHPLNDGERCPAGAEALDLHRT